MYNCVLLTPEDAYLQCFLWRNLDASREPETYQVIANNIGVKPAGAIATLALQNSAELYSSKFPVTAQQLINKSYVDDLGLTDKTMDMLRKRTYEADEILKHANMRVKRWIFSGDSSQDPVQLGEAEVISSSGSEPELERMLGIIWDPRKDVFRFTVRIGLCRKCRKARLHLKIGSLFRAWNSVGPFDKASKGIHD